MAESVDLSVVIVSYKTREQVRDCLRSLYEGGGLQGLRAEVILVDNASGDGTAQMVQQVFPQVTLLASGENSGFARANNQGIARATGRNVLLLNPDTLVPRDALEKCVAYLDNQNLPVGAMTCRVESPDGIAAKNLLASPDNPVERMLPRLDAGPPLSPK